MRPFTGRKLRDTVRKLAETVVPHVLRAGLVEQAAGGTLFLDEIGDLDPASQIRLFPASEAVWVMAALAPDAVRPPFQIMTGFWDLT